MLAFCCNIMCEFAKIQRFGEKPELPVTSGFAAMPPILCQIVKFRGICAIFQPKAKVFKKFAPILRDFS